MTTIDVSSPGTLAGAMSNTLGDLVESIAALGRMEASIAAYKAELIEQPAGGAR